MPYQVLPDTPKTRQEESTQGHVAVGSKARSWLLMPWWKALVEKLFREQP